MRYHLYKKNPCPAINNNLELTEEIKVTILKDSVYYIPKEEKKHKIPKEIITLKKEEKLHYIYLLRPKENVEHNENIFKIGKTIIKELTVNIQRLTLYGKGTELILIKKCINAHICERKILKEFNKEFAKHKFGNEYFIGNPIKMDNIICDIIRNQYELGDSDNELEDSNDNEIN
jgi:hypothetical protein